MLHEILIAQVLHRFDRPCSTKARRADPDLSGQTGGGQGDRTPHDNKKLELSHERELGDGRSGVRRTAATDGSLGARRALKSDRCSGRPGGNENSAIAVRHAQTVVRRRYRIAV